MAAGHILVATQLSSLFPSSDAPSIALQTSRRNVTPTTPTADGDLHPEHASFSSVIHVQHAGPVLLRVLHGGLIVELTPLSSQIPPIRFVFPVPVLSAPAVFALAEQELHLLAVTVTGSLYRLVLPTTNPNLLWHDEVAPNWCREYVIKGVADLSKGIVHVHGLHCVAVGLANGSLLRIETERIGDDTCDDLWTETLYQPKSLLGTFTSYLPGLQSGASTTSEILSVASHPQPTEVGHIWTLSRDRTLRVWTAKSGCVASKTISSRLLAQSVSSGAGISDHLDAEPRNLLRICSGGANDESMFAIAFIPTSTNPHSGGYFQVFDSTADQLRELRTIECSAASAHCHLQDFIINDGILYALWERQGSSMMERIPMNLANASADPTWETSNYGEETDVTPAYLDELLRLPGSLTEKFMEAIIRPGLFSPLTIRTALEQYVDACLSLPGPPPPELTASYATVVENITAVVGCTVTLVQDPHTGAIQYDRYWSALKRDWEGFVARCREVERHARWPLALCAGQSRDDVIVVERERVGTLAKEDLPIAVHRHLSDSLAVDSHFGVLDIAWTLCDKIGPELLRNVESRVIDVLHQEIAFSIADILGDQVQRLDFKDGLDDGTQNWIISRLQDIEDLDRDVRIVLDLVAGFDPEVKREEDEVELLLPPVRSEWRVALSAAYVSTSVHARYDICIALMALLFFLADDLREWDQSLLEEVFAVFRGLAMLRSATRQPAAAGAYERKSSEDAASTDDVIARMSNMQVSRNHSRFAPTFSLVHRLMAQPGEYSELPSSAHRFLDDTGLLQSTSPTHVTHFEVQFCDNLRILGYPEVAQDMVAWLPRTPGVVFVTARLCITLGRGDDAASMMEKVAGSFGPDSGLSFEDAEALSSVLPAKALYDSDFSFYLEASAIFRSSCLAHHEVYFLRLALSVAPPDADTADLWYGLIRGYIDLSSWEEAYSSIIATPFENVKRDSISQLVYQMCEQNAIDLLVSLDFAGFGPEVDDALAFKARNTDPRTRPFYSRILYTWYTRRGDHRSAARTMYQRARKLQEFSGKPADVISLMEDQLESYLHAINSLSLLEQKNAWIIVQARPSDPRKRRKLAQNLPLSTSSTGSEIIDLDDLRFEFTLLSARLRLIRRDPTLLTAPDALLSPSLIILRLGQANQFELAMSTARALGVDMSELFAALTGQCMRLSRNPDAVLQEDTSDWLLTDNVSSWPGSPADRGWRYLKLALERHDGPDTDYRYSKATLEAMLSHDRSSPPPPWLIQTLEEHHHEYLIRTSLRFDLLESALDHTLSLVRKADSKLSRAPPKTSCATWLPYTLIDQVLVAAAAQDDLSSRGQALRRELQTEISNRVKRMQKMSRSPQ
ncbi:nucleoporin Nup120/160-domain-containing protein [Melanogaster broomeanus]|nr:nucleoporin Nup120/160-domain-containing protein [Melanogaster broomeanus]